ncbi:winged helix-turn-helix transcriptional regulator [candidate division WOR-3 bacterium]|nr:winged helix-turn-helix transcriptional regulator [candidate division WOR-3 bacterium]
MNRISEKKIKALFDPMRARIMSLISSGDLCGKAVSKITGISESAVSQHLKILREAGFVKAKKTGYFAHYSVEREQVIVFLKEYHDYLLKAQKRSHRCVRKTTAEKK